MLKKIEIVMLIFPIILFGCAGPTAIWSSNPIFKQVENPYFQAMVKPKMNDSGFFVMFHLEVTNRSDENLEIDWNESQYLFQGRKAGPLVPAGIDPKLIRKGRVPSEKFAPGQTIAKDIGPLRFVSLTPFRSKPSDIGQSPLSFSPLPKGYNGVQLVIRTIEKAIVEHLQMQLLIQ